MAPQMLDAQVILYSVQCYALYWTDKNQLKKLQPSTEGHINSNKI